MAGKTTQPKKAKRNPLIGAFKKWAKEQGIEKIYINKEGDPYFLKGDKKVTIKDYKETKVDQKKGKDKKEEKGKKEEGENILKQAEYEKFAVFIALCKGDRLEILGVQTQGEFSKEFGVEESTLSNWKKNAGFYELVSRNRKNFYNEQYTASVLNALAAKAIKTGNAPEAKLFLQYVDEYKEKNELEHTLDPRFEEVYNKLSNKLPD